MKKLFAAILSLNLISAPFLTTFAQVKRVSRPFADDVAAVTAPVTEFESARAWSDGSQVLLSWQMQRETSNVGFYLYRVGGNGEELATPNMVLGAATKNTDKTVNGERYDFVDAAGDWSYVIEAVALDGTRVRTKPITAQLVSDLATASGLPADRIAARSLSATGDQTRNELTLPKDLAAEVESNSSSDPTTHQSVISKPGVKISTRGQGIFRVTRAELAAGGFDVTSNSAFWQLYLNGIEQALSIGPNGDYFEFYGSGIDTIESDITTYYLITGQTAGKRIQERTARPGLSQVTSRYYLNNYVKAEKTSYLNAVLNGEAENFWGRVITSTPTTLTFNVTGIDRTAGKGMMRVKFQGYSFTDHQVQLLLNGVPVDSAVASGRVPFSTEFPILPSRLVEGANTLQMQAAADGDLSFFDKIEMEYYRTFLAEDNQLKFFTQNYKAAQVNGFTSPNVRVYDITDPSGPILTTNLSFQQNGSTFGTKMPAARGRLFYAVEDTAVKSVFAIVPNDPALLRVPSNGAELVIITHRDFLNEANAWADYRRGQGTSVKVVEVSEIYDEFNYGVLSSNSIRDFLSYASTSWQIPPRYVMLLGDASFDSRNYLGTGYFNMVPTKLVTTIFMETGSDDALADFNDDGLAEISIGRIPIRTRQSASEILAREINWEANLTNPLGRGALFAYDLPIGYDFEAMSNRVRDQLPAGTPTVSISRSSPTAQADLIAAMNTGKYTVNYTGHGSTGAWAAVSFFSSLDVPRLTNANNRSLFTMLTCLNGYFINSSADSLSEVLLKASNGGAIASWASSGTTTPDVQEVMALRFYNQLGVGSLTRLGDLVRDAKQTIPGGVDVRLSWALIGDPMLTLR